MKLVSFLIQDLAITPNLITRHVDFEGFMVNVGLAIARWIAEGFSNRPNGNGCLFESRYFSISAISCGERVISDCGSTCCDEGCVEGGCVLFDNTDNGADVTGTVDDEASQGVTAGNNRTVEGVGCGDARAGTVGFCGMASVIEDRPRAIIPMVSRGVGDDSGPAPRSSVPDRFMGAVHPGCVRITESPASLGVGDESVPAPSFLVPSTVPGRWLSVAALPAAPWDGFALVSQLTGGNLSCSCGPGFRQ